MGIKYTIRMFKHDSKESKSKFINNNNKQFVNIIENTYFTFKAFSPQNFLNLRTLFDIAHDFNDSFENSSLIEKKNTGKSKSLFYHTKDSKFIIKTMNYDEMEVLISLLPKYFCHFCEFPNSLISKFLGMYYFRRNSVEFYFVVMSNLFSHYVYKTLNKIYDLKGSRFNRECSLTEIEERNFRLKDVDFEKDYEYGLMISSKSHSRIIKILEKDCGFLNNFQIVDYSLLVGVHIHKSWEICRDNDVLPDKCISRMDIEKSNQKLNDEKSNRILNVSNGIPATYTDDEYHYEISVYIGIIDVLQLYNWKKWCENLYKCVLCNLGDQATIQNSEIYSKRFQKYLTKFVIHSSFLICLHCM